MTAIEDTHAVARDALKFYETHQDSPAGYLASALETLLAESERLTERVAFLEDNRIPGLESDAAELERLTAPPTDAEREALRLLIHHAILDRSADAILAAGFRAVRPFTDEWEYGYELVEQDTRDVLTRGWPYDTREEAMRRAVVRAEEESDPDTLPVVPQVVRRRKAGPWEPVEAARDAS